jgi:hypothetical protein
MTESQLQSLEPSARAAKRDAQVNNLFYKTKNTLRTNEEN